MPIRRDAKPLRDILAAGRRIAAFVQGMDEASFYADEKTQSAVMYQILVIGEAAKRLPQPDRARFGTIAWEDLARLRDFLAHRYDKVNLRLLWETATTDMPHLVATLEQPPDPSTAAPDPVD